MLRTAAFVMLSMLMGTWTFAQQVKEAAKVQVEKKEEAKKEEGKKDEGKKEEPKKEEPKKKSILPGLGGIFGGNKKTSESPVPEPFNQEKADIELLKSAKIEAKGPALLEAIRSRTPGAEQRKKLGSLIGQLGDDSFEKREYASAEIEKIGPIAVSVIRQNERAADAEVSRRCIRLLEKIEKVPTRGIIGATCRLLAKEKPAGAVSVLLDYLPLAEDETIAEEIRDSLQALSMPGGKPDPALWKAIDSTDKMTRSVVLEVFSRGADAEVRGKMKDLAGKEQDPDIRMRMVLSLVQVGKEKSLVPELIRLLGEVPSEKGWRAEEMLFRLAGEKAPNVSLGSDEASRKKARDAWDAWWKANETTVSLARLDEVERMLGYTLSVEIDNGQANGRVIEYGPDKKERWSVKGLQFPTDAIVMPGEKVLIAEQNAGTVSLRDIKTGKAEWTEQIYQPMSLQRLSNGNIVVGCRNQVIELNAQRKQVFQFDRSDYHDVACAAKLPNGDYVFLSTQGAQGQLYRVDKDKKIVKQINVGQVYYWGSMQVLSNTRVLVTLRNGIAEIDLETGQTVKTIQTSMPYSVQKLPNGNFLCAYNSRRLIAELDRDGKEVWSHAPDNNYRPWRARRR